MTQTIKIKRSTGSSAPGTLAQGELAYTKGTSRLYVGDPATVNTPIDVIDAWMKDSDNTLTLGAAMSAGGFKVTNVGTPTLTTDAATKGYVDGVAGVSALGDLTDVTLTSITDGEILVYDTTSPTGWINQTLAEAGIQAADAGLAWLDGLNFTNESTFKSAVNLEPGVDIQAYDADLTTIAGLSSADGNFIVGSATGWVVESGAIARTSLGVDPAGTDNSVNVTLAGSYDYLTLSGQQITLNQIDLTTDVTGSLPNSNLANSSVALGGQTLTLGAAATTALTGMTAITVDNIRIGVTGTNEIDTSSGNLTIDSAGGTTTIDDNLTVSGNLIVNGTTTTVNSTTVTIDDPIFTLGGDTAPTSDDGKDRGIEFRWHNGTASKVGFFGYDDSSGYFTFIPDATNTTEVFSGTAGTIEANITIPSTLTLDSVGVTAIQTGAESFSDNDTSLMTSAAIQDKILSYGYGTGDITSVQISSTDSSITGTGTGSTGAISFDLQVGTVDGGTY